jgi:hypothetical protein
MNTVVITDKHDEIETRIMIDTLSELSHGPTERDRQHLQ